MENKPAIFISSTIYDFADLRSALKHWLEEQGYEVLSSDANDFPVNRMQSSYKACLDAISRCNYFILLIGSRVGGLFDEPNQISITRQEYREAYKLAQRGKIKIVSFIRKDVWTYKQSQNELAKFLQDEYCRKKEMTEDDAKKILNRKSEFANDASMIMSFIDEVRKVSEMKAAITGQSAIQPAGNWLHIFSTFQEIVDCLKIEFSVGDTKKKQLEFLLEKEICANLEIALAVSSKSQQVIENYRLGEIAKDWTPIDVNEQRSFSAKTLMKKYFFTSMTTCQCSRMQTRYITESIDSGLFLVYKNYTHTYGDNTFFNALWQLRDETDALKSLVTNQSKNLIDKAFEFDRKGDVQVVIRSIDLAVLLGITNRFYNVTYFSKGILRYLHGDSSFLTNFLPRPASPFKKEQESLYTETPNEEQIMKWALS